MPQGGEVADVSPISPFLVGFKPRQVLLAERQQQQHRNSKLPTLMAQNQDTDSVLACSVALWLENKGFSKVLKRFLSVAQIQDNDWRAKAIDLNDVLSKHLTTSKDALTDVSSQKKHDLQVTESVQINGRENGCFGEEIETKKKKKKNKGGDALATEEKISKMSDVSNDNNVKDQNSEKVNELPADQSHKAKKDKKKRSTDVVAASIDNTKDIAKAVESKDKKKKKNADVAAGESKKESKKRKRVIADDAENESDKETVVQESKPKKSKGEKDSVQVQDKVSAGVDDTQEENHVTHIDVSSKEDGEENFSQPKSGRKQNGNFSAESKTVNAFQRVKIEEVEFADERLQDNSYWAKHGAETGYGAKAQEVLGQVRGRDFRHEKTKKKRGSYRGGVIDLQSHSIKFDNSDDE